MSLSNLNLNPMQKKVVNAGLLTTPNNFIVSSPTASGKTIIAELVIDQTLQQGKKAVYVAPLKSLAEEKFSDFSETFPKSKITVLTSDYDNLTTKRQREISSSDIIIMTNEMLQSRTTKFKAEKALFKRNK